MDSLDIEERALKFLRENMSYLLYALTHPSVIRSAEHEEEITQELLAISEGIKARGLSNMAQHPRRNIGIIALGTDWRIPSILAREYVRNAIKHYIRYDTFKPFSGTRSPNFSLEWLPKDRFISDERDSLRDQVEIVKFLSDFRNDLRTEIK